MVSVQFNPFTPEAQADPYSHYRELREQEPVQWNELIEGWVLTRYDDCVAVLKDDRFSANRRRARSRLARQAMEAEEGGPFAGIGTMLSSDPPDHTRLRGLVNKAFTPRVVEAMRPHIQEIVDELLDAAQERGHIDIIQDLAYPLPVIVIAEMLGVPPEQRDTFKRWSDDLVAALGGPLATPDTVERARRSAEEMFAYFRGVIAERRLDPKDDLISGLIAAKDQNEALSEEEILATCALLLAAGNETTTNLIGNGTLALFRNPEQLERLRADRTLVGTAVEELLRYDGPVQATGRVATEPVEIGGRMCEEGQLAMCVIGAANHDPAHFADPETLDIGRQENRHIAFGVGIHFCLGAPLARAEGQIAFRTLLERMPKLRQAGEPVRGGNFILRGLTRLPAEF